MRHRVGFRHVCLPFCLASALLFWQTKLHVNVPLAEADAFVSSKACCIYSLWFLPGPMSLWLALQLYFIWISNISYSISFVCHKIVQVVVGEAGYQQNLRFHAMSRDDLMLSNSRAPRQNKGWHFRGCRPQSALTPVCWWWTFWEHTKGGNILTLCGRGPCRTGRKGRGIWAATHFLCYLSDCFFPNASDWPCSWATQLKNTGTASNTLAQKHKLATCRPADRNKHSLKQKPGFRNFRGEAERAQQSSFRSIILFVFYTDKPILAYK